VYGEKLVAKLRHIEGEEFLQGVMVSFSQAFDEGLELQRLGIVVTRWAYEYCQFVSGKLSQGDRVQSSSFFEVSNRLFYVSPGSRLREYGSYDYLEGCVCGPPVLRSVVSEEQAVDFYELLTSRLSIGFAAMVRHLSQISHGFEGVQ
jgi:hypothetical protein